MITMLRLTLDYVKQTAAAYLDVLRSDVGATRRHKLNFRGRVKVSDNTTTRSTEVNVPTFTTAETSSGDAYTASEWDYVIGSGSGTQSITLPASAYDGAQITVSRPIGVSGAVNVVDSDAALLLALTAGEVTTFLFVNRRIDVEGNITRGEWRPVYRFVP